jgi:hypothetical protein
MFVAHDVELGVPFFAARPRLMELIAGRLLADASRAAYGEGLARLVQPGPAGPALARVMRIRSLRPAHIADRVTAGLRWEAVGAPGAWFPVLDADLTLVPVGPQASRLSLAGVYRLPSADWDDDPATVGQVAGITIRALLRSAAAHLAGSAAADDDLGASLPRAAEAP